MENLIKIVHIVHSLEVGGLENGVVNLVNNMDPDLFKFTICCIKKEGALKERLKNAKIICLHEKEGINYFRLFRIMKMLIKERPDIVHTHGWGGDNFLGIIGAKLVGIPIIINGEHGAFLHKDKKRRILFQRFSALFVDNVITVSQDLKNCVIQHFKIKPNKIIPIINGVDTQEFISKSNAQKIKRKELNFQKNNFIIGSVGRLDLNKDHKTLLYAVKEIIKSVPTAKFIFAGDGNQRTKLKNLASSLRINEHVLFMGERSDISELLNIMDIFVLTSLSEGLSNVILEAMSVEKPVIATKVGGNPELVVDGITGFLVSPKNPKAIAGAIIKVVKNPKLAQKMGEAGRKRVEEKFSLDRMVKEYQDLYEQCLYKKGFKTKL